MHNDGRFGAIEIEIGPLDDQRFRETNPEFQVEQDERAVAVSLSRLKGIIWVVKVENFPQPLRRSS